MQKLKFLKGKAKEKKAEGGADSEAEGGTEEEKASKKASWRSRMKLRGKKKEPVEEEPDLLEQTFRKYDVDGNGHLDEKEMLVAMKDIMGAKVTKAMVVKVMKEIDADGSGVIELDEFYDFFEKCDELVESGWLEKQPAEEETEAAKGVDKGSAAPADSSEIWALMEELKQQHEKGMSALKDEVSELRKELSGLKEITTAFQAKRNLDEAAELS